MIGPSDEEQPNQQGDPSGSVDGEKEKVAPMNEHNGGPREAARAAVYQARVRLKDGREEFAGRLERAADELRERTDGRAGGLAIERVAKSMVSTAGYLREHEAAAIAGDVSSYVKLHSTAAMVLAALVGFLLGRLLK